MLTVEALDALVHGVIYTLWTAFAVTFVTGAVLLHRHNAGMHAAVAEAVDVGHRPAHAKPARPSRLAFLLDGWRELAHAHALMTGGQPW